MAMKVFTPELIKEFADIFLDWIERIVLGSASKVDDRIVLPTIAMIRTVYDFPDNDERAVAVADNKPPLKKNMNINLICNKLKSIILKCNRIRRNIIGVKMICR